MFGSFVSANNVYDPYAQVQPVSYGEIYQPVPQAAYQSGGVSFVPSFKSSCGGGNDGALMIVLWILVFILAIWGLISCVWCCLQSGCANNAKFGQWNGGKCCPSHSGKHKYGGHCGGHSKYN